MEKMTVGKKPYRKRWPYYKGARWVTWILRIGFLVLFTLLMSTGRMPVWLALFAVTTVAAIVFGRFFCGYICPMNTLMIPLDRMLRLFKPKRREAPKWMRWGGIPWVVLGVSIAIMLGAKRLAGMDVPMLPVLAGLSLLMTILYVPGVFHNRVCPFGMLQRMAARSPWLSRRVVPDSCVGCALCVPTCDAEAIVMNATTRKAEITPSMCHQCQNCASVCPKNAIHYSK